MNIIPCLFFLLGIMLLINGLHFFMAWSPAILIVIGFDLILNSYHLSKSKNETKGDGNGE